MPRRVDLGWVVVPVVLLVGALAAPASAPAAPQNEHEACGNTRIDIGFADTVYNAVNNNGDGKIGPRRLVVNQSGTIVSRGTRLFVQHVPMDINAGTLRVEKTDGRLKTSVTICSTDASGHQEIRDEFEIPNGNSTPVFTSSVSGIRDERLSVRFAGKSFLPNTMSYDLFFERPHTGEIWEPTEHQLNALYRPIEGFAELHAHHATEFAYGAGWYHGSMNDTQPSDTPAHRKPVKFEFLKKEFELRPRHRGPTPTWDDASHQQMNVSQLSEAHSDGLGLLLSPAVNNEWLCSLLAFKELTDKTLPCNDMEAAKLQILKMKRFDEANDWYRIVTNPWDARDASYDGELPVILGVEVSDIFPASDGDWERQLDELYDMGVRLVYLAHESNSRFTGAAYHHTEALALPNKLKSWFSKEIEFASETDGNANAIGLTSRGDQLVRALMDRNMLIDIDHASRRAINAISAIARERDYYPLYAGHSRMESLLTDRHKEVIPEFNVTESMVDIIRQTGGVIGMRPGPEGMKSFPGGPPNNCDGSVPSLIQTYEAIDAEGIPAAFGSDINGFVTMLAPRFGIEACPDAGRLQFMQQNQQDLPSLVGAPDSWDRYKDDGLSDIGALPAVVFDMKALGADTTNLENSGEAFLDMWYRAYDPDRAIAAP